MEGIVDWITGNRLTSVTLIVFIGLLSWSLPVATFHVVNELISDKADEKENQFKLYLANLESSVKEYFEDNKDLLVDLSTKVNSMHSYQVDEKIRFVEKQFTKITEKPDDFYESDLEYCINYIWPTIPKERKTIILVKHYEFLVAAYEKKNTLGLRE